MKLITTFLIAVCAISARAGGLESLETFVRTVKSAREGQAARTKTSSGTFEFSRPGRFRFVYKKPFAQTIVADGQTLWLYDVDLNQVTSRKQAQALGSTPPALIASAADLQSLQADFALTSDTSSGGLEWVLATPKAKDSGLQSVRVGFRAGELAELEIVDSFGQRSNLRFSGLGANAAVDASVFQFKPPSGVDVIRQ